MSRCECDPNYHLTDQIEIPLNSSFGAEERAKEKSQNEWLIKRMDLKNV